MKNISLSLRHIGKIFNRRTVLKDISADIAAPGSLAVTGRNGSGKSTLVRIIAGVLAPSGGAIEFVVDGSAVKPEDRYLHLGFVAPYLFLYDEFSARENLELLETMRSGTRPDPAYLDSLFELVGLPDRQHDMLGTFSSGMKQRVKYIYALLHRPSLLILDEPTANLDDEGIAMVERIVREQREERIVIVATNEADEAAWCGDRIEMKIG